jgi:hypothetical protein
VWDLPEFLCDVLKVQEFPWAEFPHQGGQYYIRRAWNGDRFGSLIIGNLIQIRDWGAHRAHRALALTCLTGRRGPQPVRT